MQCSVVFEARKRDTLLLLGKRLIESRIPFRSPVTVWIMRAQLLLPPLISFLLKGLGMGKEKLSGYKVKPAHSRSKTKVRLEL